jgi:hypothetical protein
LPPADFVVSADAVAALPSPAACPAFPVVELPVLHPNKLILITADNNSIALLFRVFIPNISFHLPWFLIIFVFTFLQTHAVYAMVAMVV